MPLTKNELEDIKEKINKPFSLQTIREYKAGQYSHGTKIISFDDHQRARLFSILEKHLKKEKEDE